MTIPELIDHSAKVVKRVIVECPQEAYGGVVRRVLVHAEVKDFTVKPWRVLVDNLNVDVEIDVDNPSVDSVILGKQLVEPAGTFEFRTFGVTTSKELETYMIAFDHSYFIDQIGRILELDDQVGVVECEFGDNLKVRVVVVQRDAIVNFQDPQKDQREASVNALLGERETPLASRVA